MHNMFDASGETLDPSNINLENMPDPTEIHEHINGMLDGKLGNLAKEIAEDTANELNMDMGNASSMNDVFEKCLKILEN